MNMIKKIIKENYLILSIIVMTIISFYVIKNTSLTDRIIDLDLKVINIVHFLHLNGIICFMEIITNFGDWFIPVLILLCIFLFIKNKWYFYLLSSSYFLAGVLSFVTKYLINRPRPTVALIRIPTSYSFPSGHTLTSIVFYLTLCYLITVNFKNYKRYLIMLLTLLLILIIALSRVYLGVHYFSDVIGGFILGTLCEIFVIRVINQNYLDKIVKKRKKS